MPTTCAACPVVYRLPPACRSLGCCFYELSAQKPAFNAFNLSGLVTKIKRGDMPRLPLDAPYSREWEGLLRL